MNTQCEICGTIHEKVEEVSYLNEKFISCRDCQFLIDKLALTIMGKTYEEKLLKIKTWKETLKEEIKSV